MLKSAGVRGGGPRGLALPLPRGKGAGALPFDDGHVTTRTSRRRRVHFPRIHCVTGPGGGSRSISRRHSMLAVAEGAGAAAADAHRALRVGFLAPPLIFEFGEDGATLPWAYRLRDPEDGVADEVVFVRPTADALLYGGAAVRAAQGYEQRHGGGRTGRGGEPDSDDEGAGSEAAEAVATRGAPPTPLDRSPAPVPRAPPPQQQQHQQQQRHSPRSPPGGAAGPAAARGSPRGVLEAQRHPMPDASSEGGGARSRGGHLGGSLHLGRSGAPPPNFSRGSAAAQAREAVLQSLQMPGAAIAAPPQLRAGGDDSGGV